MCDTRDKVLKEQEENVIKGVLAGLGQGGGEEASLVKRGGGQRGGARDRELSRR